MTETTSEGDHPTIAVTGAAGYIGSRVVQQLRAVHPDWNVVAVDNFYLGDVREIEDISVRHLDIRNRDRLEEALDGADIVMHLAAISGVEDCEENRDLAYEVNVQGTANVAWFCRKTGAGLVFPFSMAVLGDPETFPITSDLPRDPMNWYGRTKLLGEHLVEDMADGEFPAHLFLKSNLYGEHEIDGRTVSKGTVINFFVNRVFSDEPLTVYEPGTQSRNYVHVKDVARAYLRSAEVMLDQLDANETGVRKYELASEEDPSVMEVAELVQGIAADEADIETEVSLVENPREGETLVSDFAVDTTRTHEELGWETAHSVEESIRELIRQKAN
ncbi:NAD-dependent epimerase/dehydratase family protein [Halorussus ruber]|uniref:NAD-dependent epimerase/dehydratase family protein n=1 Tax=Halorussus ruber TaxID=1126238 RepID=UPI00109242FA|nr:NAD(P)-dependent oxidoreductase [Halorussus ruber]